MRFDEVYLQTCEDVVYHTSITQISYMAYYELAMHIAFIEYCISIQENEYLCRGLFTLYHTALRRKHHLESIQTIKELL